MTLMDDGSELKSSTSSIRNGKGEVIYASCVNFNTTDHHNAIQMLQAFVNKAATESGVAGKQTGGPEKISFSIDHTAESFFEQSVTEIGKRPASMNTEEKIRLVKILEKKGAFQIKGMVGQVALRLGVSNFTIYNYLKKTGQPMVRLSRNLPPHNTGTKKSPATLLGGMRKKLIHSPMSIFNPVPIG